MGTKADLVEDAAGRAERLSPGAAVVSGETGEGIEALTARLAALTREAAEAASEEDRRSFVVLRPAHPRFVVRREGVRFRVVGRGVERWVADTDFEEPIEVAALQRKLVKEGVERQLTAAGARRGDEVVIGDRAFGFEPEREA